MWESRIWFNRKSKRQPTQFQFRSDILSTILLWVIYQITFGTYLNHQNLILVNLTEMRNYYAQQRWKSTSKSLLEAFILASTNPQYDIRLFIELRVQYMKTTSSEHVVYTNCFLFLYWQFKTIYIQCIYTTCSELFFMYW